MLSSHRYFALHKPYGTESQFISNYEGPLLGDLSVPFPEGTHAIGRLDKPSEGLLLLTTNKKITRLLFQSAVPHRRTYQVQVKNVVSHESLAQLRNGVSIRISGDYWYNTPPCEVEIIPPSSFPSPLPNAYPVKSTWLQLTITEGKFRQVRKMVAAVRHPCIRLLRISIEDLELGNLAAGAVREVSEPDFFRLLKLQQEKQ
ncbi:MAG: rRNA pseudouridine synthase [Chitinophagaceae bacterium]|nr:MAG: rRNA pseudouridine synthase [Chitinophagaceae bacterium]